MASIAPETVFTKTAKGILDIRNKTVRLSRELGLVFLSIDGRSTVGDLTPQSGMSALQLQNALQTLVTDGYIKPVAQSVPPSTAPSPAADDELDFTSPQAMSNLNMEAASRALAAADATKRAQAEARAALDARMRQESEARARVLAEARAKAEAAARQKAEEAAHAASEEHARAASEASAAADAGTRTLAEARARAASAAVVRAQAEARARAEAEQRANALAEEKRAAEEEARQEAQARARSEEQAHARAAAERGASEALEAQVQAMEGVRAHHENPDAAEAEAARARVRELEGEAERAREAARAIAKAEGRADEVPQPEMDIADRVRQLNARVQAARISREDAARQPREDAVDYAADGTATSRKDAWPSLQLGAALTTAPEPLAAGEMVDLSALTSAGGASTGATPALESPRTAAAELPVVDLGRTQPLRQGLEHEPTPLERAMAQIAAKSRAAAGAKADAETDGPAEPASPVAEAVAEPEPPTAAGAPAAPGEPGEPGEPVLPTIDDSDPPHGRVNIDRAAHDVMAEAAEARRRTEAAQPPHSAAALTRRVRTPAKTESNAARAKRHRKILVGLSLLIFLVPALAVAYLQFVPLNGYITDVQKALSQRLNQPVTISTLRYVMLPSPRLVLEGVSVGATGGVRAGRLVAHVSPVAALSGTSSFAVAEAHDVEIEGDVLGTIPAWTGGRTAGAIHAQRLELTSVTLKLPEAALEPFNGEVAFAPNGTVKEARFASPKMKLELTPSAEGVRVTLNAIDWRIPYGPPIPFSLLTVRGLIGQNRIAAAELTGRIAGGDIEGALTARWGGPVALQGEFKMERVGLRELLRGGSTNFEARGTLRANGRFSMQAPDWKRLTASPQIDASFAATRGELTNIDIVRAIQSPAAGAMRGGRTAFEELSGTLQVSGERYSYRNLRLASGPLNVAGAVDVGPGDQLAGRIVAELAGRGARSTFVIRGTVPDPQLQR